MKYKCIKTFSVNKVNENWEQTDELFNVEKGSIWWIDEDLSFPRVVDTGGISLEDEEGQWLEIYPEDLRENFEALESESK